MDVAPGRVQWQQFIDNDTGMPYYFNATTGETQWEEPDAPFNSHTVLLGGGTSSVEVLVCVVKAQALIRYPCGGRPVPAHPLMHVLH